MFPLITYITCLLFSLSQQSEAQTKQWTEKDYQTALEFFQNGGSWAVILAAGTKVDSQKTWTVLVLSPAKSKQYTYTLGAAELGEKSSIESAQKVMDLYDAGPDILKEFLRRYAGHLQPGILSARLWLTPPVKGSQPINVKAAVTLTKKGLLDLLK